MTMNHPYPGDQPAGEPHDGDPTQQLPVGEPHDGDPTQQLPVGDEATPPGAAAPAWAPTPSPVGTPSPVATGTLAEADDSPATLAAPSGLHLPAILLGLVCLAVAGLALAQELGGVDVDWTAIGPLGFVAVGAVLVVLGVLGLLGSRRRDRSV